MPSKTYSIPHCASQSEFITITKKQNPKTEFKHIIEQKKLWN